MAAPCPMPSASLRMLRQAHPWPCARSILTPTSVTCMTAAVRKHLCEHPDHFDPRQYLADGRQAIQDMVRHKIRDVLGSSGKA